MRFAPIVAAAFLCFAPAVAQAAAPLCPGPNDSNYCQPDGTIFQSVGPYGPLTSYTIRIDFELQGDQQVDVGQEGVPDASGVLDVSINGTFDTDFGEYAVGLGPVARAVSGDDAYTILASDFVVIEGNDALWLARLAAGYTFATDYFDFTLGVDKPDGYSGHLILPTLTARATYTITPHFADSPVPEPATWAMMIAGFGLTGGVMRRRRRAVSVFAA